MSASDLATRSGSGGGGGAQPDRFGLLLLEDGEYYFKGHTAYHWVEERKRVVGSLKVCSRSLFFVPRDVHQPIFRVPFQSTTAIEQLEEASVHGEDMFEVAASLRVDMKVGNTECPYQQHKGAFRFRFSLVYASLDDVLPQVEELCLLAHAGDGKEQREQVATALQDIIKEHEEMELFNPGWLEDEESVVMQAVASCVSPLAAQAGRVVLTQQRLYFQPFNLMSSAPIQAYQLAKVVAVMPRVYQLEDLGLEVFFSSRHSLYLAFRLHADRARFQRLLLQQPAVQLEQMRSREQWTRDWVNGRISNFDYLMHLNREAGRSFKDLSQYPVMPWVVADYVSPTLDLSDPATYRDLSQPIGALNPRRLQDFRQRYQELKQMAAVGGKQPPGAPPPLDMPPFLYGCHYSSPGYVVFYLMRSDPQLMLSLQNGRFDSADRLFWSIADTWKSVLSLPSDVKELVPEFYSNDVSFLLNKEGIDFGTRSNGQPVGGVQLPPWAADAHDFLYKLQEALESPLVSAKLHKWIDLVFGRKARGARAEAADNVFHYLTYDEVALRFLEGEEDAGMRDALRLQMMEFGRTPRQLFNRKHPKRKVLGRGGALACFGCFASPAPRPKPANLLTGKPWDARSIPPVSRAVFKLSCSPKRDKREALLQFLEHAASHGEPDALALRQTKGAELILLVKAARDAREGRPSVAPAPEMLSNLVRAVAALATCPQNRRYILEAGCLDALAEALAAAEEPALAAVAVRALAQLSQEDSPRLQGLSQQVLASLLGMLRQPPSAEALLEALSAITNLAEAYPSHRTYFARQDLLGLLQQQLHSAGQQAASAGSPESLDSPPPPPRPNSRAGLLQVPRAESRAARRRATMSQQRGQQGAADTQQHLITRQQLLAMAVLLQDDGQKEAFLAADAALPALLADCSSPSLAVRGGAYECIASLTAHDAMRQQVKELHLLPLLLEGAACSSTQVQRPAAACVANMCADPGLLLAELGAEGGVGQGLAPVVALALAADGEVQRHAAAALWHLAVQPEARRRAVEAGALNALLSLAKLQRNVVARDLARQALLRCRDDEAIRPRLEEVAAATGVEPPQLSSMLTPSCLRSGSFHRKVQHRKMYSEVPSSFSGAISRSSSFKSLQGAASPALSGVLPTTPDLQRCSESGGQSPPPSAAAAAATPTARPGSSLRPTVDGIDEQQPVPAAAAAEQQDAPAVAEQPPPQQKQQQPLAPLEVPQGSPLPLPILSPVGSAVDGGTPAKRQLGQDVRASAAAMEAANSSPRGAVAGRVQNLERLMSRRTD